MASEWMRGEDRMAADGEREMEICELCSMRSGFFCHHCVRLCHFDLNHLQWNDIETIFCWPIPLFFPLYLSYLILDHHYGSANVVLFLSLMLVRRFGWALFWLLFISQKRKKNIQRRLSIDKASWSLHGVKRKRNQAKYNGHAAAACGFVCRAVWTFLTSSIPFNYLSIKRKAA